MKRALSLAALILFGSCAQLPDDYESLDLEAKLDAAEEQFARSGHLGTRTVNGIVNHGAEAAEAMIPYLRGEDDGLPRFEAARIVWMVQLDKESLRGTEVERALLELRGRQDLDDEGFVEEALQAIQSDAADERVKR